MGTEGDRAVKGSLTWRGKHTSWNFAALRKKAVVRDRKQDSAFLFALLGLSGPESFANTVASMDLLSERKQMKPSTAWRDSRQIVLFFGLFVACCLLAGGVRAMVAADRLSDLMVVVAQLGTLAVFICSAAVALWVARHVDRRGARMVLRILPLALALVGATFARTSYANVSIALQSLTEKSDGSSTTILVGPTGRDIRLTGDLTEGAAARLEKLLALHPKVERIHLTSDGGLADEGEALRKVIAAHGLTTYVPDYCVSACTLAFLGGPERYVTDDARLGFHAPYEEGLFGQTFASDNAAERAHYLAAGVTQDFIDQAFKVDPNDIWTPDADRLIAAHVVTAVVDRYRFPDSNLDGIATAAGARTTLLRNFPLTQALESARPRAVDRIAAWYVAAYREGRSEGDIVDDLKDMIGSAASVAMKSADDETLVGFGRYILSAMRATDSDESCAAIGTDASLIEAESTLNADDTSADKVAVALLSRALNARRRAASSNGEDSRMLPTLVAAGEPQHCGDLRALYTAALDRPKAEAAARIRALITPPSSELMPGTDGIAH